MKIYIQFYGGKPVNYWYRTRDGIHCVGRPKDLLSEWLHCGYYHKVRPDGLVEITGLPGEPARALPEAHRFTVGARAAWAALVGSPPGPEWICG